MGKKIVNSIIFLAGLAAILVLTSHFLKPNDDVYNTNGVMAKKEEFQKETNDTIDVILSVTVKCTLHITLCSCMGIMVLHHMFLPLRHRDYAIHIQF